jgi:hypothetical protein
MNVQIGRIALRVEGDFWRAYFAEPDTMKGATMIGSIRLTCLTNPECKRSFIDLMQQATAAVVLAAIDEEVVWPDDDRTA